MARSISDIYNEMNSERQSMSSLTNLAPSVNSAQILLNDLNSTSKVAYWRLFMWVIAYGVWVFEMLIDLFKADVDATIARFRPGTLRWYQEQALLFQDGHELTWNITTRKYEYATADENSKLVKLCSATAPAGIVRIKAAKLVSSEPTALSSAELARLQAYYFMIGYPIKLVCVSYSADMLKITGTIKYNPLSDVEAVRVAVEVVINAHLKALPFDGRFNVNALIDKVQAVIGVEDFIGVNIETKYGLLSYTPVVDEYQTNAGYARIDTVSFPLHSTLTYIPYV